jgi:hypothetical protein
LLGLIGGAIAIVGSRGDDTKVVAAVVDSAVPPPDAAVVIKAVAPDAAVDSPSVATVKLTLQSTPPGASVYDDTGALLGKTPVTIQRPISTTSLAFELKLAGYKVKRKDVVVDGEMTVGVALEKAPKASAPAGKGSAVNRLGNDLVKPE